MNDQAHELTDAAIAKLERQVAKVYKEAADEMQNTIRGYFSKFHKMDAEQKRCVEEGTITEQEYKNWRISKFTIGKRYREMQKKLAERFTNANETTMNLVNGAMPQIYALNRNYTAWNLEKLFGNLDFTLFDENTVKRLIVEEPDLLPYYPKELAIKRGIDLDYGKEQITRTITSDILQGKSISDIAKDLSDRMEGMNRASAVRAARTAATSAENAGRMDSYQRASDMGIQVKKRWIATKDGRTRDSHRHLDGQTVDWDEPFSSKLGKILYPGDRSAKPGNVYNCRCTMRTVEASGIEAEPRKMRVRDPKTGRNVLVSEMSYEEWKKWVQSRTYSDIIGKRTSNGIEIKMVSAHSLDRGDERGVTSSSVLDAVTKPLYVREVKTDKNGKKSQRFIGREATVNVNPDTGNIVTVWKTGARERKRYGGE